MNKTWLLLALLLLGFSCDSDERPNETSLIGRWMLYEENIGIGPPGTWKPAEIATTINLNTDSTFSIEQRSSFGTYTIKGDRITFLNVGTDTPTQWISQYELNEFLFLSPWEPACYEGCVYKYKRVKR